MLRSLIAAATLVLAAAPALPAAAQNADAVYAPPGADAGGSLGGGFIEYLFRGGRIATPAYAPPGSADARAGRPGGYAGLPPRLARVEVPARPAEQHAPLPDMFRRHEVAYSGSQKPGTIVIDTAQRFLFLVEPDGRALRYGIGVGREGFAWHGTEAISAKREWPGWTPPADMLKRQPNLPRHMDGGPGNPLGARALYLGGTLYRIHGTSEPWTIGHAVSSGCIRMTNQDVIDLYGRVKVGTTVVVL
ncbi:MAG TPA: L,D-transpeptidase [Hyphomicrobiales bacterium]|nr:L,D-transpeptidase [Hyphomicrobiales bacterium]